MQDDPLFAFAGLWDRWKDPSGTEIESCTILTTTPNSLLADVHDRMPVIVRRDTYDLWLDPGFKDLKALAEVLAPVDAAQMKSFPVSTRINATWRTMTRIALYLGRVLRQLKAPFSGRQSGLTLTGLPHHLNEHSSSFHWIAHFPREGDTSSLHAILGFQAQVEA